MDLLKVTDGFNSEHVTNVDENVLVPSCKFLLIKYRI